MTDDNTVSSAPGAAQQNPQRGVADEVHGSKEEDEARDALSTPTGVQGEEGGGAPDASAEQDSAEPEKRGDTFEGLQPHRKYDE